MFHPFPNREEETGDHHVHLEVRAEVSQKSVESNQLFGRRITLIQNDLTN